MPEVPLSVLITGANGFVGSRLCRKFLDRGFRVIGAVRKTSDLSLLEGIPVVYRYGDVTQPETLPEMVAGVDYVIHNAGVTKVKRKSTFFAVNEHGTASLFEALLQHNARVKKVILISSLAAVGPSRDDQPLTEQDEPHPISAYGRSKFAAESAAVSFSNRLPLVALRPPGIYGPGDKEILSFFRTVNLGVRPYLGDCRRKLQLVHVDDLCAAVHLAVIRETKSPDVYFIAEKRAYSMRELIELLAGASGKKTIPVPVPSLVFKGVAAVAEFGGRVIGAAPMLTREKARELLASWEVSTDRAKQRLGFESQISFEHGARETYRWYREKGWLK